MFFINYFHWTAWESSQSVPQRVNVPDNKKVITVEYNNLCWKGSENCPTLTPGGDVFQTLVDIIPQTKAGSLRKGKCNNKLIVY